MVRPEARSWPQGPSLGTQGPVLSSVGDTAGMACPGPTSQRESRMDVVLAYIDPGSGSLLIQALIAGLVALPIFFRQQITRAVRSLRGGADDVHSDPPTAQDDAGTRGS